MASTMKDNVADAGHVGVGAAKNVGNKIAEDAEKAVDKAERVSPPMPRGAPALGNDERCTDVEADQLSPPMPQGKPAPDNDQFRTEREGIACIKVHMNVIASCGKTVGVVDAVEGRAIKLTKKDNPDDQHHFIPVEWVERVDSHVHLNKNSMETAQNWKSAAAACVCSG